MEQTNNPTTISRLATARHNLHATRRSEITDVSLLRERAQEVRDALTALAKEREQNAWLAQVVPTDAIDRAMAVVNAAEWYGANDYRAWAEWVIDRINANDNERKRIRRWAEVNNRDGRFGACAVADYPAVYSYYRDDAEVDADDPDEEVDEWGTTAADELAQWLERQYGDDVARIAAEENREIIEHIHDVVNDPILGAVDAALEAAEEAGNIPDAARPFHEEWVERGRHYRSTGAAHEANLSYSADRAYLRSLGYDEREIDAELG